MSLCEVNVEVGCERVLGVKFVSCIGDFVLIYECPLYVSENKQKVAIPSQICLKENKQYNCNSRSPEATFVYGHGIPDLSLSNF